MSKTALISVIVPIYKVEQYLQRCLNSIVTQSYTNLEIILIDDGSPDNCPSICDDFARNDKRITVIHKQNGGLSDARNTGIEICRGDFVFFLDSDDWIDSECIESLFRIMEKSYADIVIGNYSTIHDNNYLSKEKPVLQINEVSLDFLLKCFLPGDPLFTQVVAAWNKLVKRDIVKKWLFPKGLICEDHYTTYKYYFSANKVVLTNIPTYFYQIREGSIVNTLAKDPIQDKLIQHDFLKKRIDFFLSKNKLNIASLFAEYYTRNALFLYIKSKETDIEHLHISNYNKLIKSHIILKTAAKHPSFFFFIYRILQIILPNEVITNVIYGKDSGLIGIVWQRLHLPNTQFKRKFFNKKNNTHI